MAGSNAPEILQIAVVTDEKKYPQEETPLPVLQEPDVRMKTFSSQEEADLHRLKKNLARTDMERFQIMCRMIRIGKMLSQTGKTSRL